MYEMRQTSCKLPCHIEKYIHIGHLSNHGKIVMNKGLEVVVHLFSSKLVERLIMKKLPMGSNLTSRT